jgi:hypothetical protein
MIISCCGPNGWRSGLDGRKMENLDAAPLFLPATERSPVLWSILTQCEPRD